MKIVKLADLSEEEKEEYERQRENRQQSINIERTNEIERVNAIQNSNKTEKNLKREPILPTADSRMLAPARNRFYADNGERIRNSKALSEEEYKKYSFDEIKKEAIGYIGKTLWDDVKDFTSSIGKNIENTWLGLNNGILRFGQTVDRRNYERIEFDNKIAEDMYASALNLRKDREQTAENHTPLFSQDKLTEEKEKSLQKKESIINENNNKIQKNVEEIKNPILRKTASLAPSVGQMIPTMLMPTYGAVYATGSATGEYHADALKRGMNDEQAKVYAGIMGVVEGLTEKIELGRISKGTKSVTKGNVKQALKEFGIGAADNFVQEAIIEPISELTATMTGGSETADWDDIWKRMLEAGIDGALTSMIISGVSAGIGSAQNVYDKVKNGEKISKTDLKMALQEIQNSAKIDVNEQLKNSINQYKDYYIKKNLDGNVNDWMNKAENIINSEKTNNDGLKATNKLMDNSRFIETAKRNSIDINSDDIRTIDRVLNERKIQGEFNNEIFKDSSQVALWKTSKDVNGNTIREVLFNPKADSSKTIQNIAVHEMWHDFEGTKLSGEIKNLILNYDKTRSGYEQARNSLAETYSKVYDKNDVNFNELVENEAVADILGQKLGNQEFINNLTMQNRTIGQKIYDWVVDKLNKINKLTGYRSEKIYWTDVKNKFENAFKQGYQNSDNSLARYSIMYNRDGSFSRVKIEDNIFENNNGKSINNTIKNYLEKHINEYANIIESGQRVYLGEDLPSEYTFSKSSQNLPIADKLAKGRASSGLKEIIENASNRKYEKNRKAKHNTDAKYGFYKYDTSFSFDYNGKEQIYKGTIVIRNDVDGKKYLYDIVNIKKIGSNLLPVASNSQKSSAIIGSSSPLPINSIPSSNENVNTNKYSMQNNKNNSWQSYLDTNYKTTGSGKTIKELKLPIKQNINEQQEIDTELNKIYNKRPETAILPQTKILDKYNSDKRSIKKDVDTIIQKTVNKGHYIDKLAKKTGNKELTYKYDRMLNAQAEGQYTIGVAQTDNNGKVIGKSVNEIWKPAEEAGLVKEFSEYLLHKHNISREGQNKAIFGNDFSSSQSRAISEKFEKTYPQFKDWANDVYRYNQNNLENMVDAGLITKETKEFLNEMYPNYVTISRQVDEVLKEFSDKKTGTNNPLKKAKFANADIKPLKDSMAEQAIRIKKLVRTNEVGLELRKTLKNSEVATNYDEVYSPTELFALDTVVESDNQGNKYCVIFENGVAKKIEINDDIYKSLKPSTPYEIEKTLPMRAVQKVSNIHKNLLTSNNPIFVVTNFFKDFQDGMFNSRYSSKFIKNYAEAIKQITTKGEIYNQYMANGGGTNTYFDYNSGVRKEGGKISKFINNIRSVNEMVEQAPRLAEYISTLEDGKTINEALYNAAEITTNFKRGGDITKALNRNGAEFLNASVQGLSKQYRNLTGQNGIKGYVNLLIKASTIGMAPAILNHMLLKDDEDYEDLPESTKDLYYLFKCKDNTFIRIPKGRVVSIFGAIARRTLESLQGQDDAFEGVGSTVINQIAPNNPLEDNILAPIIQVKNNKTWYGSDLVPQRLRNELPKNQYDEKTDNFSRYLGEKLNISPIKINYLLDQYSGGLGDVLLPMITPESKENVLVDKFTTNSVLKNKNVSKFFDTIEKQTQITNDTEVTDEDELKMKYLNSKKYDTSALYKQKREIQLSNLSNSEKKQKVEEVQKEINAIVEEALKEYKNIEIKGDSAVVGGKQYYKGSKGNWQELSENEITRNTNIPLAIFADYKTKTYKRKEEMVKSGVLKENGNLPDREKNEILYSSNYSNKEKQEIYKNYINTQDEKVDFVVESGISINEYLKFKAQDFNSEKDESGNIIKTKKQKVYEYLNKNNKLNLSQKAVLLKIAGYSDYNKVIVDYVNSSNISNPRKKEFLELLGIKVNN